MRLLRGRPVAGANLSGFLLGGSFFAFLFVGTLYMQQVLGFSALKTGLVWMIASVTSVALAGLSQYLATRIGAGPVLTIGMTLIAGGIAWGTVPGQHAHVWGALFGAMFVTGAGTAFAFIPISIAGLTGVSEGSAGLASGLLNTSQQLGGAIGVAIASTVAATRTHTLLAEGHAMPSALTGGFHLAIGVAAAVGAAGVVGSFVVPRMRRAGQAIDGGGDGTAEVLPYASVTSET